MVKEYYKKIKELGIGKLLLILLAGILLVISYPGEEGDKEDKKTGVPENTTMTKNDNDELSDSIREILLKMAGVEDVSVMVTYQDSGQKMLVSAKTTENDILNEQDSAGGVRNETSSNESEEYLYIGEEPYVVMQKKPTICGVVVVYKGNADAKDITEAVKVLTGADYNRIKVSLMN